MKHTCLKFTCRGLLPALAWLGAAGPAAAQPERAGLAAADVRADLTYLAQTLPLAHYNLYAYANKAAFARAYQAGMQALGADSVSRRQATLVVQQYAATANTGHCEVDFPAASYIAYARQGGLVFPLELAFEAGKVYVRRNFSGLAPAAVGAQVLSIDGVPVNRVRQGIHPYLSGERPALKDAKLEFWSFPRLYWAVFGAKKDFEVKLKSEAGQTLSCRVPAIPVMEYEQKRGGEILRAERSFKYLGQVAYLHPGAFSADAPDGEARFRAFVDSAFADFRAHKATTLVLDLRNNSGGDNAYSDYLLARFAGRPFRWYSKFSLKTSPALKAQTRQHSPPNDTSAYTRAILGHADGEVFDYNFPTQQPVPADKRFAGQVFVLVNRQTYSMAAVSAALIQDYGFGKIVGEETADLPTLHASQFSVVLPRTGIVVKVPKGYMVRPGGSEKPAGVRPDFPVPDHLLDERDEVLDYLLNKVLRAGIK